jgi:D-beta-D-heptose 7-phosphate kinase/D-beta-D-heptose 1-phosphate adenosyltransferase
MPDKTDKPDKPDKIVELADLRTALEACRAKGLRIVFTNGCFDIIHVGHVRYLREAGALGDLLVVGLNSDASVGRIKPGRPVNNERDRAEVLAALEMVDFVVIFTEDTPYELIRAVRPDALVKGGDWKREDIVGSDIVPEVYSLRFHEGVSTTSLISRIKALDG